MYARILRTSRNAADCLFSTMPKGLRIGCFSLQKWLSHFGAKDGQWHCISTCLRAARYKYLPILKRKIWGNLSHDGEGASARPILSLPLSPSLPIHCNRTGWIPCPFRLPASYYFRLYNPSKISEKKQSQRGEYRHASWLSQENGHCFGFRNSTPCRRADHLCQG